MAMRETFTPIVGPLRSARFIERPNRFVVRCRLEPANSPRDGIGRASADRAGPGADHALEVAEPHAGDIVEAHIPDRGRLEAVLIPGRRIWLRPSTDPARRTAWSALLAESPSGTGLVSLDTTLPNRLIARALHDRTLDELRGWTLERAEWRRGASRFDFLLAGDDGRLVLEVKSVGLVDGGIAYFPDGVTARGARHLRELAEIAGEDGWQAAVLFVAQRDDAREVRPAAHIDPGFAAALEDAARAGVRILGRRCRVRLDGVSLAEPLPVIV